MNQIFSERWNSTQPTDDMTFDQVITWKIKNITEQFFWRLHSPNTVGKQALLILHFTGCNHIMWHLKTSWYNFQEGYNHQTWRNAYQNERLQLYHVTWPNHAKGITATVSKLALVKLIHSYGTYDPRRDIKNLPIFFAWVSFIYMLCVEKILLPQLRTMDTSLSNRKDSCCSEILSAALNSSKKRHYLNQFFEKKVPSTTNISPNILV